MAFKNNFLRSRQLLGDSNHEKLRKANVFVAGLGAVGSFAVESLVRSGVGNFILNDSDVIEESNLNRQIFALSSTLKKDKTQVAWQRIIDINPEVSVIANKIFLEKNNFSDLLNPKPDIIIDAIDSVGPKAELLIYAVENEIPVVSSMGAAGRTDPSLIKAADISESKGCRLARTIRKSIHKRGIFKGIRCVYSEEQPFTAWASDAEMIDTSFGKRASLGSISSITGIFGLLLAHEALKVLLGDDFPKP